MKRYPYFLLKPNSLGFSPGAGLTPAPLFFPLRITYCTLYLSGNTFFQECSDEII
jgi:hypothetical protein